MYAPYFGLKREPFSIAPDPRFLFMSERHREALAHLLYGLQGGGGFVLLSGEIGAGKTTVCRCFLQQIPQRCNVAYIFNPKLSVTELLKSICEEFRIAVPGARHGPASVKDHLDPLNDFMLRAHALGQTSVLVIDEAQNLSADVLEQLRLLTNLETSERKLLQIILIGQPELRSMLARPELEQLAQRVIARFHLEALSPAETSQYIAHRLAVAGLAGASPFDAGALQRIQRWSRGVPRRINLLCDRAMLGAYAHGQARIDRRTIDRAAAEVYGADLPDPARTARHRHIATLAGAVLLGGAVAVAATLAWQDRGRGEAIALAASDAAAAPAPARLGAVPVPADPRTGAAAPVPLNPAVAGVAAATEAATSSAPDATAAPFGNANASASAKPVPAGGSRADLLVFDPKRDFAALPADEAQGWRVLAALWQLPTDPSPACTALQRQQVRCLRSNGSLATIASFDRPGLLTLHDAQGATAYALLTGLDRQGATLRVGDATRRLPLAALSTMWRGEFATLWRAPAGYDGVLTPGAGGAAVDWLAQRLAALQSEPAPAGPQRFDAALRARLQAFQVAHGLAPDGLAGPTTFMQLNRASGVDEPRLNADR